MDDELDVHRNDQEPYNVPLPPGSNAKQRNGERRFCQSQGNLVAVVSAIQHRTHGRRDAVGSREPKLHHLAQEGL